MSHDTDFKHDWGDVLVDIVKKKDLDCGDWADCWNEGYDWEKFDLWIIENFEEEVLSWAVVRWEITEEEAKADLQKYIFHYIISEEGEE